MRNTYPKPDLSVSQSHLTKVIGFHKFSAKLFAVFCFLFLIAALDEFVSAQTVITPNNLQNWSRADTRPGGGVRFVTDATTPSGTGALRLTTDSTNAAKAQFLNPANTPLSSVTSLGYYTKQVSSPFANGVPSFQVAVYLNGTPATFTTLVYEPYNNGETITPNAWQQWNPYTKNFWSSKSVSAGGACVVNAGAGGPPFYTLTQLKANCPSAVVVGYGVNVGSFNPSYNVEVDLVNFNGTVYDFEPSNAVTLTSAVSPTATDNDYTRINNAVQLVQDGATITLNGTFNWAETNAAASWALGSDGQTGGVFSNDDYEIFVPSNLNGVTFTAASLGAATIQGPGDLPNANLEGVLDFEGGPNQNWTISNIRFLDFDLSIGMFSGAGGVTAYNGTKIQNNYILVARDLNATVAPIDVNQNIGIHFAFGTNQQISGNTIELTGDGVSDTANNNFSVEVGIQSNTSGGAVYDGLQITNNIVRVLNAQTANPEVILGIWENAHGHSSNITVSGNQFLNAAAGNNPASNLQRGFRVTSHSSATTTVTYSNNSVQGANIGFQWLPVTGATQPVNLTSNLILNNATGVKLDSGGLVNLRFNRIVGNSTAGVDNTLGTTATAVNNWWGCNYGPGLGGAGCSGTANGVLGTVAASPYLTLRTSATPNAVVTGGTSNISSNLNFNSANTDTSGLGSVPNGTPANFTATLGTVAPTSNTTTSGVTGTTFTAGAVAGSGGANTTIDGQTVNAPIAITFSCNNVSIPTGTNVPTNTQFVVPVTTDSTTGRGIISFDFKVAYNPAVVTPILVDKTGTLSSGFTITTNNSGGVLIVSGFGTTPLTGSGTLINLKFISIGGIGTTSGLNFNSFQYNNGVPCINTTNGSVTIISGTVTGIVRYGNGTGTLPVVRTTLSGAGSPNVSAMSDLSGNYSLSGFGSGAYTVTPSKPANQDVNGIQAFDAALIAQHVVGLITLNATQLAAANVSNSPQVSSFDAALIAQYVVSIPNPGVTGSWRFTPVNRSYSSLATNQTNQDYTAILMGDVNGDWANPSSFAPRSEIQKPSATVNVTAPTQFSSAGASIVIPLTVGTTTGEGIISYQFDLVYDSNVILAQTGSPCDVSGTISSNLSAFCNPATPGILRVAVFGATPITGSGILLNLKFNAVGIAGSSSPLTLQAFQFNNGIPPNTPTNGQLTISGPSAAAASLSGSVTNSVGGKIRYPMVTITDSTGAAVTKSGNAKGKFVFTDLQIGELYTVTVSARNHTFRPQVVSVVDDLTELNFIAEP